MNADDPSARTFSLKRWSRKKREAERAVSDLSPGPPPAPVTAPAPRADPRATESAAPGTDAASLPPVETLTIDSDYSAFLQPKVDEGLRRRALRQLFRDPHFNVMDGLDVYIDDYSTPDPISPDIVRQMVQSRYIFDPPKTRMNECGVVEDIPSDDATVEPDGAPPSALPESAPPLPVLAMPNAAAPDAAEPAPAPAVATPPERIEPARR